MNRIVIIGAGPAGLTAGYELVKRCPSVEAVVLEESQVVGGISRTVCHNGNRMDIGGHRFFSKDVRVNEWWEDVMPLQGEPAKDYKSLGIQVKTKDDGPDPDKEDRVMLVRNRVSRIYYQKKFFDYPVKMNANTIRNLGFATTLKAGFSYLASCICKKDEDSLENFYINRFGRKLYSMFFEGYTEKLWGRHPRDISADWGAQRVKGLSIMAIIKDIVMKAFPGKKDASKVETSLIEEFSYPKYGPGQLWETVAEKFQNSGGKIIYGARVIGLLADQGKNITSVTWVDDNGLNHVEPCDILVSSMPLKDLVQTMPSGMVPTDISTIASGLPYRDFVTVGLLVNKLSLENTTKIPTINHLVPDNWIYVQDTEVKMGRIQIFNNWSPYMVASPEDTVWIGLENFCAEGDEYWTMPDEQWQELGIKELQKMGVLDDSCQVLDFHVERVKKAYPAYFDTYERIDELVGWLDGIENLYCIGRNGQHRYNNMDHSMETAFQAVDNILSGRKDKKNIWNVNTEQEYHEEKA